RDRQSAHARPGKPSPPDRAWSGPPGVCRRRADERGDHRMSTISTADSRVAAQAVHDLGAALWFGGSVMGVAGVNKAGADLRNGVDKVRVAESAWRRFAPAAGPRTRAGA